MGSDSFMTIQNVSRNGQTVITPVGDPDKVIGVYTIQCQATGKTYVGSSSNVMNRIGTHKLQLRKGAHTNHLLLSEYQRHGEGAFKFALLTACATSEEALREEAVWIRKFRATDDSLNLMVPDGPAQKSPIHLLSKEEVVRRCVELLHFSDEDSFKSLIEHFLVVSGITATAFGRLAISDPNFVFQIRNGERSCSLRVAFQVRDFIKSKFRYAA